MKRKIAVVAMLCVGVATTLLSHGKGSSTSPLQVAIVDGYAVASDGRGPYTDHTANGNLEDTCVSATTSSNGFTQISLNYLIQTGRKTSAWCNPFTSNNDPGFDARTWSMVIADSTACSELGVGAVEPCTFTVPTQADERILPGNVFSSKSTPVTFQFELNGSGYSVQTDGSALVAGDTSTRTVTYSGDATLFHSGTAISIPFSLPFQLVITKE